MGGYDPNAARRTGRSPGSSAGAALRMRCLTGWKKLIARELSEIQIMVRGR